MNKYFGDTFENACERFERRKAIIAKFRSRNSKIDLAKFLSDFEDEAVFIIGDASDLNVVLGDILDQAHYAKLDSSGTRRLPDAPNQEQSPLVAG